MEPNENMPKQPVRPVNPAGAGAPRPAARPVARPVVPRTVASAPVAEPVEPVEPKEPTFDNGPSVVGKKERKTGWVLALILLFIIAAGGVGFGVWAWMDGNTQKDQLNSQISSLQQQNAELQDELASGGNVVGGADYANPVIVSQDSEKTYTIDYSSSKVLGGTDALGESNQVLDISVANGKIVGCSVSTAEYHEGGGVSRTNSKDCVIDGLDGDIYKIVEFGAGHDNLNDMVGFIMTNGTVYYLPLYESVQNENYSIRGKVNLPGKVVDILTTGVSNGVTGWIDTVFVFEDGTIIEYDESMLN